MIIQAYLYTTLEIFKYLCMKNDNNTDKKLEISNNIVSCPQCGCDYTYNVGYDFRECFECLNTWSVKIG